jgi:hypothetical protein
MLILVGLQRREAQMSDRGQHGPAKVLGKAAQAALEQARRGLNSALQTVLTIGSSRRSGSMIVGELSMGSLVRSGPSTRGASSVGSASAAAAAATLRDRPLAGSGAGAAQGPFPDTLPPRSATVSANRELQGRRWAGAGTGSDFRLPTPTVALRPSPRSIAAVMPTRSYRALSITEPGLLCTMGFSLLVPAVHGPLPLP